MNYSQYDHQVGQLREAIERSIRLDEGVPITLIAASIDEVCGWIHRHLDLDYETDYVHENDGRWDVWGYDKASPQDPHDWRLLVTIKPMAYQYQQMMANYQLQLDCSDGHGHCWLRVAPDFCPPSIAEEIAAEIIDGRRLECDDYVASNGQHYRWGV